MQRLTTPSATYVCARAPRAASGGDVDVLLAAATAGGRPPALLYWDAATAAGERVRWGQGGLDPVLAGYCDLSGCVAIRADVLERLVERKALTHDADIARALMVLLRGASLASTYCEGLVGEVDELRPGPLAADARPGTTLDRFTVALMLGPGVVDIAPFLSAVSGQHFTSRVELLLIGEGLSATELQRVIQHADAWTPPKRLRVRRHAFGVEVPTPYVRNAVVALSAGEVVVFADPRAAPSSPEFLQTLADWAGSGGVATACSRLERQGRLLSAGLALRAEGEAARLAATPDPAFSRALRQTAAPHPWLFGAHRAAWMASGGVFPRVDPELWTSGLAGRSGPAGRSLLVGSLTAEWEADDPPPGIETQAEIGEVLNDNAAHALRTAARASSRAPAALASTSYKPVVAAAAVDAPPPGPTPATRRPARDVTLADVDRNGGPQPGLADEAGPGALRLLVLADAFGPTQAIAFEHGLAAARRSGRVAVRAFGEDAFEESAAADQVEAEFRSNPPDVVIASRLGRLDLVRALRAAADARRTPFVFHIDDDLFDPPPSIGIERYRLARSPRRLAALQEGLLAADVALAATPALAERLRRYADRPHLLALSSSAAGAAVARAKGPVAGRRLKVGYMGSASHDADLAEIAPALNEAASLASFDLELFGSIAKRPAADLLTGLSARHAAVVDDYGAFKRRLAELKWDVGLAPLRAVAFNRLKTPIKWAEYAEAGVAVLASAGGPYDEIARAGGALTVEAGGWTGGLARLLADAALRRTLVAKADALLGQRYSWARLGEEIEAALASAMAVRQARDAPRAA